MLEINEDQFRQRLSKVKERASKQEKEQFILENRDKFTVLLKERGIPLEIFSKHCYFYVCRTLFGRAEGQAPGRGRALSSSCRRHHSGHKLSRKLELVRQPSQLRQVPQRNTQPHD